MRLSSVLGILFSFLVFDELGKLAYLSKFFFFFFFFSLSLFNQMSYGFHFGKFSGYKFF